MFICKLLSSQQLMNLSAEIQPHSPPPIRLCYDIALTIEMYSESVVGSAEPVWWPCSFGLINYSSPTEDTWYDSLKTKTQVQLSWNLFLELLWWGLESGSMWWRIKSHDGQDSEITQQATKDYFIRLKGFEADNETGLVVSCWWNCELPTSFNLPLHHTHTHTHKCKPDSSFDCQECPAGLHRYEVLLLHVCLGGFLWL